MDFLVSQCIYNLCLGYSVAHQVCTGIMSKKTTYLNLNMWMCTQSLSHVQHFVTPWTVTCQAPLSMGFSRQGYGSGVLFPSSGNLPDPGNKPASLVSPALAGGFFTTYTNLYLCLTPSCMVLVTLTMFWRCIFSRKSFWTHLPTYSLC